MGRLPRRRRSRGVERNTRARGLDRRQFGACGRGRLRLPKARRRSLEAGGLPQGPPPRCRRPVRLLSRTPGKYPCRWSAWRGQRIRHRQRGGSGRRRPPRRRGLRLRSRKRRLGTPSLPQGAEQRGGRRLRRRGRDWRRPGGSWRAARRQQRHRGQRRSDRQLPGRLWRGLPLHPNRRRVGPRGVLEVPADSCWRPVRQQRCRYRMVRCRRMQP